MLEIPEATVLAAQVDEALTGRVIDLVEAGHSPHKFAWYFGSMDEYQAAGKGKRISGARAVGGMLEIHAENAILLFSEGAVPRLYASGDTIPQKHQFFVQFVDGSFLAARVSMYGGMGLFKAGQCDNDYYLLAQRAPTVLTDAFSREHFELILDQPGTEKLSVKALLATEQRIPGLGNGVLQDILFNARVHPRRKVGTLDVSENDAIFHAVKSTLKAMADARGRDTEADLFGQPGGYRTRMSRNTVGTPCPMCGETITKASYMGGSVYFCPGCQLV